MMKFPRIRHKLPVLLDCLFPALLLLSISRSSVVYVYKQATCCSIFTELHVLGEVSKGHWTMYLFLTPKRVLIVHDRW
jgi:hypothetical protein